MVETSKVLVVDDNPEIILLLRDFLTANDCVVYEASTGRQAIDVLLNKSIEIAILDVKLPDTDGLALLDTIRLHDPTVAVVMITGYGEPELIVEAMKKGASDFVMKPFSIDRLLLVVMNVRKQRELSMERCSILPDLADKKKIELLDRQLQTKVAQLTKMYHISNKFNSLSVFEDIYRETIVLISDVLNADVAGYYVVDRENRRLILHSTNGNEKDRPVEKAIPLDTNMLEEMTAGRKHFIRGSHAYSSLIIKGECVGALMMGGKLSGHMKMGVFSNDDLYFLKLIADKASIQIENRMLYESLYESVLHTLTSLIVAINRRDRYTEGHCKRVSDMCIALADRVGATEYEKGVVRVVAPIHDVGKIGIPDSVLLKPGMLTDEEYDLMKSHPIYGEEIINRFDILSNEARITRHHHEWFDGSGYPDRLSGSEIPFCSRVVALCDTYDAMMTDRPYRKATGLEETLTEIRRCRGKQFDPDVTDCFVEMVSCGFA